ncbi:RNA recognition motif-containing protein [Varicellaria rhodocarpa]|nr:RNA recognition motif-containing protein [Varicellaria rhodocarpa]
MDDSTRGKKRHRVSEVAEVATSNSNAADHITEIAPSTNQSRPSTNSQQSRSLFIRSLPSTTTTESLTEKFSQSYPLKHATVVVDPVTKQSRGFGFVTFVDASDAQSAREEFNGSVIEGRKIKVEIAEPRHRDPDASGLDGRRKNQPFVEVAQAKAERERQRLAAQTQPKLIVRNLPWSIKDSEQLALLFRSYGKVKHATIPKPKVGLSAGFGFVVLRGRKNAEKALAGVNGKEVDGRTLAVDWAVDKEVWQNLQTGNEETVKSDDEQAMDESEVDCDNSIKSEDEADGMLLDEVPPSDADPKDISSEDESDTSSDEIKTDNLPKRLQDNSTTLFVRNLPFSSNDETLREKFEVFGPVRYAKVVLDQSTGMSKGTGFVCFFNSDDALTCVRGAPRPEQEAALAKSGKKANGILSSAKRTLLEDTEADPSGRYIFEGRVLQITRAVDRNEATRLTVEGTSLRDTRDKDKRRIYLLSEGTIPSNSPAYSSLSPSEIKMREDSARQRQSLMKNNPSLHVSLTRLSIRNIPRNITSKDLKALARQAIVGFAKDVKQGGRGPLSKEELSRGGNDMKDAERDRKAKGKGIVKQAKVVFEGREGGKVTEDSGAGRSRGYGFVEYFSHRSALMGLRWLNGHSVGQSIGRDGTKRQPQDRKKRLIAEFAIENAQVIARRYDRESKARDTSRITKEKTSNRELSQPKNEQSKDSSLNKSQRGIKRKRVAQASSTNVPHVTPITDGPEAPTNRLVKRQQIIGRKRILRKAKKLGPNRNS